MKGFSLTTILMLSVFCLGSLGYASKPGSAIDTTNCIVWDRLDMQHMLQKWKQRDGAACEMISDVFCEFELDCPGTFLSVMSVDKKEFNAWVSQLQENSFIDWGNDCLNRECLRKQMLETLYYWKSDDKLIESMRRELIAALKKIHVEKQ